MLTFIFYSILVLGLLAAMIAFSSYPGLYWLAGLFLYVASFLGGFSIGLYLLVFTFIF